MEITTIIGIIIAVVIMLLGIKMIFKKPAEAVPSLDADLHIDPDSQTPVIPRHVRSQLNKKEAEAVERVEPRLHEETPVALSANPDQVEPGLADAASVAKAEKHQAVTAEAKPVPEQLEDTPADVAAPKAGSEHQAESQPQEQIKTEESKADMTETVHDSAPEFSLNSNIEKAEISEFNDESSILDAHLHEQKIVDEESALANAEMIISLHIYPQNRVLSGDKTLKVLLKYGLRYGELACFHRYSEDGSKLLFSVLRMTDTGMEGFDLETLSTEEVKGLAFFLALPHSDVQNAFDTMDSVSRLIAREVDGIVYDQNHQEFTPQLREFWRHQAIDYRAGQTAAEA